MRHTAAMTVPVVIDLIFITFSPWQIAPHVKQQASGRARLPPLASGLPPFSTHMADAATDTYDRDFALSMLSCEQDSLYEIDEALDRIRDGTYGVCELTGKKIEPQRLEAIPWTRFTAEAEKQLEKQGA